MDPMTPAQIINFQKVHDIVYKSHDNVLESHAPHLCNFGSVKEMNCRTHSILNDNKRTVDSLQVHK